MLMMEAVVNRTNMAMLMMGSDTNHEILGC